MSARFEHVHQGKVRDLYDAGGGQLLMVASDRISAFDVVMNEPIPDKGRVLTAMSVFWFETLAPIAGNHLVSTDLGALPPDERDPWRAGRCMLVRRCAMVPVECVVRGYLAGSGWKEYEATGTVCGVRLPPGLREADRLPRPIFTPTTKAPVGTHDEAMTFDAVVAAIGGEQAEAVRELTVTLYRRAAARTEEHGILLADTKFELGLLDRELVLADEVLTPDSSRFWPADAWEPGTAPPSFDKQPVRDELEASGWPKTPPPPALSPATVAATRQRYVEAYERVSGRDFADWPGRILMTDVDAFHTLRNGLLAGRTHLGWPDMTHFNWALDHFDTVPGDRHALWIVEEDGREDRLTFAALSARSNRIANYLRDLGVGRGDHILLMLGNVVPLWETMLAAMKLGAVMIPASTLLGPDDLVDRVERGDVKAVVAARDLASRFDDVPGAPIRIAVGDDAPTGWQPFADAAGAEVTFTPDAVTAADDPLLLYFTSGTTSQPKLVLHTHRSYPVGHLSTMYWIGLQPGDVHLNISSPGWAKHAWSCFFAPWNAEATVFLYNYSRFDAPALLDTMARCGVTTFCAPPTVWRMLIQEDLTRWDLPLRELVGAGEPLNPEVIEQVKAAWGITIRDGYGQTETTAQIGNAPGMKVKPGSMGRPLPGYAVALLDAEGKPADEGEISLDLSRRPIGLMVGYLDDPERTAEVMRDGYYHTGDVAQRDADGYITYVGRTDDVFKASDYRISPFELESVLIEHEAVAEAAVVPSPDPLRLAVPKAFVVLAAGYEPDADTARSILEFSRTRLAPYKRIRRIEFADLPKTISGKIRRVELRTAEHERAAEGRNPREFWETDLPG